MNDRIEKLLARIKVNEQFERLAKQAECSIDKLGYGEGNLEMFGKLIVLECVNIVMDGTKEGDYYGMRIEQHFDKSQGGVLHFGVE